jgi:exodeoxyribonuclease-5
VRYDDVALLCYRNETRVELNAMARAARKFGPVPVAGDQVICLRNTDATIFNGMRGMVTSIRPATKLLHNGSILFEDDEIEVSGLISAPQFNRPTTYKDFDEFERENNYRPYDWGRVGLLMDFGYCLTTHKAQGSSFEHVIVVMEKPNRISFDDWKRWAYTAVTRASKYLAVLQ